MGSKKSNSVRVVTHSLPVVPERVLKPWIDDFRRWRDGRRNHELEATI